MFGNLSGPTLIVILFIVLIVVLFRVLGIAL